MATPKQGLRHPAARSFLPDLDVGTKFQPILLDKYTPNEGKTRKVIFCSGAVWLKIQQVMKTSSEFDNCAIVRIEELSPFPMKEIEKTLKDLGADPEMEVYYLQEEHINLGSFAWCKMHLQRIMTRLGFEAPKVTYIGRGPEATMATASSKDFKATEEKFMKKFRNVIGIHDQ